MSGAVRPDPAAARPVTGGGDIGRRVAERRARLGLSREELAARAGTSSGYVRYLEEYPADPGSGALLRIAAALDTTAAALHGGGAERPPGIGRAAAHPELLELGPGECRDLLATHGVGRISVATARGPAVIPVNYSVVDDAVVFRTAPDATPAAAAGTEVAFEVDHIDEALSEGWSVLVVGRAQRVTDPAAVRRLAAEAYSAPWPGGSRDLWLRIEPTSVTGRRIRAR
ncbi:pyridoxamine 5'-phosphate oxidase family protein [Streptomyces sp. NA02950]|uniref:helix-turn-helix domain-containing protein n=1 Tax=Streptomyces sp. NA02950 TaxID=2742137 RepID=UPI0015923643|nr:pyridoxamine 5'-phosphate oxidase family protein [Streptomyces sp. NA02950]QKV91124.1 pyridoxamine 5'-phosphate oxidase family protein [Streptomyces sp. NA02950]